MNELDYLRKLEIDYIQALNDRDRANQRLSDLRSEIEQMVSPENPYQGEYITAKVLTRRGLTDWKAATGTLLGGDAESIDALAEKFRKPSTSVLTITRNKKNRS